MTVTDQYVRVAADGTGKKIDNSEVVVGVNTVERQRINVSDPIDASAHAAVIGRDPLMSEYALATGSYNEGHIVALLQMMLLEIQEFKVFLVSKLT